MVDPRFFPPHGPMGLLDLLKSVGADDLMPVGISPELQVTGADELDAADGGEVSFAAHKRYVAAMRDSRAGIILTNDKLVEFAPSSAAVIICKDPHALFVKLLNALYPTADHRLAVKTQVPELAEPRFEENVTIGPNAVIGSGVEIGRDTIIGANCTIGPGVTIGRGCIIGPGVTLECSYLGDKVTVHTGARIGAQGFGWLDHGKTNVLIPQVGRVIVQSHAEIGPNSVIDRGALGDTVIGEGTKLGGLVEVGHGSRLGRYCLVAPTSGLSGGTKLGDGVLLGAGSGTSGHLTIGSGSVVHGRSAVVKDWPENSHLCGVPARDVKDFWRELAVLRRISRKKGGKS